MQKLLLLCFVLLASVPVMAQRAPSIKLITGDFKTTSHQFSIALPEIPDTVNFMDAEAIGEPGKGAMAAWKLAEGALTAFHMYYEKKTFDADADRERFYKGYIEGYLLDYGGKVISETDATMGGQPGKEVIFINDRKVKGILRMIASGNHAYILNAQLAYEEPEYFNAARKVFDTFKILPPPKK